MNKRLRIFDYDDFSFDEEITQESYETLSNTEEKIKSKYCTIDDYKKLENLEDYYNSLVDRTISIKYKEKDRYEYLPITFTDEGLMMSELRIFNNVLFNGGLILKKESWLTIQYFKLDVEKILCNLLNELGDFSNLKVIVNDELRSIIELEGDIKC